MPSCWVPASEEASPLTPSSRSPSEAKHPDGVVEQALALGGVGVEQAALAAGGHRHADRVAHALAQRAGGGLDAGGVVDLGVAGGQRAPGAQRLEVVELQAVAGEVELDVEGEAGVPHGEHEPVAGRPSSGRWGRAAATSGRAGRPPAPCSSPCRGGRCRPSAPRPWRARGRCRWPCGRGSPKPSGRVGSGWRGEPVGASLAASAGASASVLLVPLSWSCGVGAPSGSVGVGPPRARCPPPRADDGARHGRRWAVPVGGGRAVVIDDGPTRCARSINVINPSGPRASPAGAPGYSGRATHPRRRRTPWCPAARATPRSRGPGDGDRRPSPPAGARRPARRSRLRGADQAPDHRAAAGHDAAGDDAGRRRLAVAGLVVATLVGGTLAAGAANVFNCWSTATSTG